MSVLTYLREMEQLKGTKNGCSSGDCGACTVVLGERIGDALRYRAANSCITPLGSMHGKQLITVEHLKEASGLHSVQQAMVDCHASQCGFCTPGIVMSLFAHLHTHEKLEKDSLIDSLSGNLCRCTGYRPILEAGVEMYTNRVEDKFTKEQAATVAKLKHIADSNAAMEIDTSERHFFAPQTIRQLISILQRHPQATLLAGGTDLMHGLQKNAGKEKAVVYIGGVKDLLECADSGDAIQIGAAVTFSDCAAVLVQEYPELQNLLHRFGSIQIRNMGTLAGNIGTCSPCGDMLPFLIVVGAQLAIRSGEEIRHCEVEHFVGSKIKGALNPGEFIERILVPKHRPGYVLRLYKVSKRLEDDISSICGAFYIKTEDGIVGEVSMAYGGMAEITKRAAYCEAALLGQPWNQAAVSAAMQALEDDFTPISDFRASAGYRMQISKNMLQRLLWQSDNAASETKILFHEE